MHSTASAPSLLGTIFGIGEFEGQRDVALRSTSTQHAFELALLDYVAMNSFPASALRTVLVSNSDFLMGHVLVGASQHLVPASHDDALAARESLRVAQELLGSRGNDAASQSERLHVHALDAMVNGRAREAAMIYETILSADPSDLLALRCSYDLYLQLGDYKNLLGTVSRRLPLWSPAQNGYSHLLSMQAFGLMALGRLDAAEMLAEKALTMNGNDRWALHTMLHIYEARGNANHGASYAMQHQNSFDNGGPLERHLYFQWGLFLMELGRYDRINKFIELHMLQPNQSSLPSVQALCDATQMFWRLHFAKEDTSALLHQLVDAWHSVSANNASATWSPLQLVLRHSIFAASGATHDVQQLPTDNCVDASRVGSSLGVTPVQLSFDHPPGVVKTVYDDVCMGLTAYGQGAFEDATAALTRARGNISVLGHTHVEHDLFDLLAIDSASRCADLTLAKLLLNERLSARPQSAQSWQSYSRVSETIGDASAMRDAQNMSYVLGLGQGGNQTH
ncbi:TPA: hypothetical protein N0F65_006805 [Lagenidium giganteum]|uniref:Tetratricopeptide repeat protein 38 n=1 Tax=Lagenidium giganteum TaxID=4803 RepID=A0AAV2Z8B6_9STRA|nr:TPA: hypothetical protein N0F65_006805 [Lagenidium giganteum]